MNVRQSFCAVEPYRANLLLGREIEARCEAQAPHSRAVIRSCCFLLSVVLPQVNNYLWKEASFHTEVSQTDWLGVQQCVPNQQEGQSARLVYRQDTDSDVLAST